MYSSSFPSLKPSTMLCFSNVCSSANKQKSTSDHSSSVSSSNNSSCTNSNLINNNNKSKRRSHDGGEVMKTEDDERRNGSGQNLDTVFLTSSSKKPKKEKPGGSSNTRPAVKKEKLGERITALQQLVSPFGKGASKSWKIPIAFISVILLPIVGNAAEHDISLGVAIGSSTQIAMFGVDSFLRGCGMDPMDLNFQLFETATLFSTVLVVAFLVQEGTSNYFKGLMLILCYLIVAASFFVHMDPAEIVEKPKPEKH